MTDQASREGFEKFIKSMPEDIYLSLEPDDNNGYEDFATQVAYAAWQAALTHANTEMEKMREALEWHKPQDKLPEYKQEPPSSYKQVECLVYRKRKGVQILVWNCEHICWDDASGDDYECDANDVELWAYLPYPAIEPLPPTPQAGA